MILELVSVVVLTLVLVGLYLYFFQHIDIFQLNNNTAAGGNYPTPGPKKPPAPPVPRPPTPPPTPGKPSTGTKNQIGINLGSWLTMETWMFDYPPFKPQANSSGKSDFGGKVPNKTNYQRGELGTIREVNGDSGVFNGNIPPTDRSDAPAGKQFMENWWKTWLSTGDNTQIKQIQESPSPTPQAMFSVFKDQVLSGKMDFHRIPIGYWVFSDWSNVNERGFKENRSPSAPEPQTWYNNEGFVVGGKKYLTTLFNFIKSDPELSTQGIQFVLDLHALPGVQTANSDFDGWNTGVQNSFPPPPSKLFSGGTWQTTPDQYPIQNDPKRNNINWVYPGPLPGTSGVTAFSGFQNWVDHSVTIVSRICDWVTQNNFEDLVFGIEPANEPASDDGRVVVSWNGNSGKAIDNSYINIIKAYLKTCYGVVSNKLSGTNFIISVIANSFYGNGEPVSGLLSSTSSGENNNTPIVIDTHRYLNWGFIPSFNAQGASASVDAILGGQDTYDVPNTLSYNAPWKTHKSIQGEWSIAINNNGTVPSPDEAAELFGYQVNLIRSQQNLVGGCYWMLRAGYGLIYTNNIIQYKPGLAWNNSGPNPGDPWQNKDWVWSYGNIMFKFPNLWSKVSSEIGRASCRERV